MQPTTDRQLGQVRYIELRRCINVPPWSSTSTHRHTHLPSSHPPGPSSQLEQVLPASTHSMFNTLSIVLFFLTHPKPKPCHSSTRHASPSPLPRCFSPYPSPYMPTARSDLDAPPAGATIPRATSRHQVPPVHPTCSIVLNRKKDLSAFLSEMATLIHHMA